MSQKDAWRKDKPTFINQFAGQQHDCAAVKKHCADLGKGIAVPKKGRAASLNDFSVTQLNFLYNQNDVL